MSKVFKHFIWSKLSKVGACIPQAAEGVQVAPPTLSREHRRSVEMLKTLQALIESGASFRMEKGGPIELHLAKRDGCGVLECVTSGSSGAPKVIRRSHKSWITSFDTNVRLFELAPHDTYAVLGSLQHSLSLYGVLEAAHIGADICTLAGLRPDTQLEMIEACEITVLYATPTQLERMIALTKGQVSLAKVKHLFIGGGALSGALAVQCRAAFSQAQLHPFYGASETSFITLADLDSPDGSVGKAYPGVEILIRNRKSEEICCVGEVGEIWVHSPYVFTGYASSGNCDTKSREGYISVGELGYLDEAGNLFVKGRISRMVTVSDQNVFPDATEHFLTQHIQVGLLAVVPIPDTRRGHRLAVVIEDERLRYDLEKALELCRETLGTHSTPKHIFLAPTLPQLPSGKLDYVKIQAWSARRL